MSDSRHPINIEQYRTLTLNEIRAVFERRREELEAKSEARKAYIQQLRDECFELLDSLLVSRSTVDEEFEDSQVEAAFEDEFVGSTK
jgi:hypothetical protein